MIDVDLTVWDGLLIAVVTAQSLAMAYAGSPRFKRLFMTLPFPFTVVVLSVGRPIDASNFVSMAVLLGYTQACRLLPSRFGVPIVPTILVSVAGYTAVGWLLSDLVPTSDEAFWISAAVTVVAGFWLARILRDVDERPYRTTLPLAVKLPVLLLISTVLVLIKNGLQGFAGFFPLVSVIAAYETRTSPWTLAKPVPVLMITIAPMLVAARLVQPTYGLGTGMAAGWLVFLFVFALLWRRESRARPD